MTFCLYIKVDHFSKVRLREEWLSACQIAKIPYIPFTNSTRHSKATNIMREYMKKGIEKAREQIGHRECQIFS